MRKTWIKQLEKMGACGDALEWCRQFDTIDKAWQKCERGDRMLWLLGKLSTTTRIGSRKKLTLCACECAMLELPYVMKGEDRPRVVIETAEAWARGKDGVTLDMVRTAIHAASYIPGYPASGAAYIANATVYAAIHGSVDVSRAAYLAPAVYVVPLSASDVIPTLRQCADIVRKHYPEAPNLLEKR